MKVGIIGGTGKMGQFFVTVFERAGHTVLVSGRKTALTNAALASECDIVIVSVPIRETVRVIEEIAPLLHPGQLLCDLTSLKARPVEAMLRSKARVIGLHPMFGPTVRSLRSQTIIVCPARADEDTLQGLLLIFQAEGARCTIATPEQHDRMMAVVQGLTHYVTLCMADSIRRIGMDIEETQEFTSPVYQIELSLMGRLLSQDPALYSDILEENPYVPEVLAACQESAAELAAIVNRHDPALFSGFFERNSRHLGSYCDRGQKTTDALIESMVNKCR
jgi:prephenate dehydrogenase